QHELVRRERGHRPPAYDVHRRAGHAGVGEPGRVDARVQERLRPRRLEGHRDHPRRSPGQRVDRRLGGAGADAMMPAAFRRTFTRSWAPIIGALAIILLGGGGLPAHAQMLDASKLSKLPKVKRTVEPEYPKEALEKRLAADVVLLLDL